ncbi:MAG: hypothetical protein ACTSQF_09155 [Candidatus Heimdallarchaeaceae archaeon]
MTGKMSLEFLKFPPNIADFHDYESKIQLEISSRIVDVRNYILTIMKDLKIENKKLLLKLKTTVDSIKTQFEALAASIPQIEEKDTTKLTLHHETLVILDFFLLSRFEDFSFGLQNLERTILSMGETDVRDLIALLLSSVQKIDDLLKIRELTHTLAPSQDIFSKLGEDFEGDIAYLETLGLIHEYEELTKPLLLNKQQYFKKLKQYFHKICLGLMEKDYKSIEFSQATEIFKKQYPHVEFNLEDLESVAFELQDSGILGVVEKTSSTPMTIVLADDSSIQRDIMEIAKEKGYTTREEIINECKLPIERVLQMIKKLEDTGLAIVDEDYSSGNKIYFPGLYEIDDK